MGEGKVKKGDLACRARSALKQSKAMYEARQDWQKNQY